MNDIETQDRVNDQSTKINFGRVVARSTSDKNCKLATAVDDALLGVALRHPVMVEDSAHEFAYQQWDAVCVMKRGWMWAVPFENVTEGDPAVLVAGQSGKIGSANATVADTVTVAADSGNSGNGVLTKDATTPLLDSAQNGVYVAKCITAKDSPSPTVSTWEVRDPHGALLGTVNGGGTFANQIKFAITDGSNDYAVDDFFTITVAIDVGRVPLGRSVWESTTVAGEIGLLRVDV